MSRLIQWKTPFASASWPSSWVSMERVLSRPTIYVHAEQLWQINFDYVAGIKVCDESYDDNTRFHIERDVDDLCSYYWEDSDWLEQFNSEGAEACEGGSLAHYVILGGDYNIEILALGNPRIVLANGFLENNSVPNLETP